MNVIGAIFTKPGGPALRQTIFHPFKLVTQNAHGKVLQAKVDSAKFETKTAGAIDRVIASAVHDVERSKIVLFILNRDVSDSVELSIGLRAFPEITACQAIEISGYARQMEPEIFGTERSSKHFALHGMKDIKDQNSLQKMASPERAENRNPQSRPEQSAPTGVVERLAIALARDIAGGIWKPNETLPIEPELAHRFGAGRNAVREAVKILVAKGLVRTERRTGTSVRPESCWNLMDAELLHWILPASADREALLDELSELRAIIEPTAASLAATHASALETMRLFEAYDEMEKEHDQTAINACIRFHELLFEASHNRFLHALAPAFSLLTRSNFEVVTRSGIPVTRNLKEHRQIADALSRRDSEAARRATRKLIEKYAADFSETQKLERRKSKE